MRVFVSKLVGLIGVMLLVVSCSQSTPAPNALDREQEEAAELTCECIEERGCVLDRTLRDSQVDCVRRAQERRSDEVTPFLQCLTDALATFNDCTRPLLCSEETARRNCGDELSADVEACPEPSEEVLAELSDCGLDATVGGDATDRQKRVCIETCEKSNECFDMSSDCEAQCSDGAGGADCTNVDEIIEHIEMCNDGPCGDTGSEYSTCLSETPSCEE